MRGTRSLTRHRHQVLCEVPSDLMGRAAFTDLLSRGLAPISAASLWRQLTACGEHGVRWAMMQTIPALQMGPAEARDWLQAHGLGQVTRCSVCLESLDPRRITGMRRLVDGTYLFWCRECPQIVPGDIA